VKSFSNFIELTEIFDTTLDLHRHKPLEDAVKERYYPHTLTNVEAYHTTHKNTPYVFLRFKHKNAWEVHFSRADDNSKTGIERLHQHKGAAAAPLVGTAIKLYKDKLDRGQSIRYFGDDEHLNKLYDSAFKHISKRHYNGNLYSHKVDNFVDSQGETKHATEMHSGNPEGTFSVNHLRENYISPYIKLG
jgi:hypothetical protein